jgi:hypothetical protein
MASHKSTGKRKFKWTEKRMMFVLAWKGDDADAARAAKFSDPIRDSFRLMQIPEIAQAIEDKRKLMVGISAKKIATTASKLDVTERALKLADMDPKSTNNNINGQVAALKLVAEMQGHIVRKHEDVTKQFDGKTDDEKEFFAVNGYFPKREPDTIN